MSRLVCTCIQVRRQCILLSSIQDLNIRSYFPQALCFTIVSLIISASVFSLVTVSELHCKVRTLTLRCGYAIDLCYGDLALTTSKRIYTITCPLAMSITALYLNSGKG